jgi:hypothetical protein
MGVSAALFGPHLSSFPILFLLLMGIATLAFVKRFSDERLFMVPLIFTALSVMLLTPLLSDQAALDEATDRDRRRSFWREVRRLLIVAVVAQTVLVATVYDYLRYGRVFANVWHRAFVSLSIHPDWPFGNLREVYDCTKVIPEGLTRRLHDPNGECVWFADPANRNRSMGELLEGVFGHSYEATLRRALFNVIHRIPDKRSSFIFIINRC